MRKSLKITILVCFISINITGCVGGGLIKAYEGPKRPNSELAILITEKEVKGVNKHTAYLSEIDGKVYGSDAMGYPNVSKVLPGKYKVKAKCYAPPTKYNPNINRYAYVTFDANFKAKHYYLLTCKEIGRYAEAVYIDLGTDVNEIRNLVEPNHLEELKQ